MVARGSDLARISVRVAWLLAFASVGCASSGPTSIDTVLREAGADSIHAPDGGAEAGGLGGMDADGVGSMEAGDLDGESEAACRETAAGSLWAEWPMPDPTANGGANSPSYDTTSADLVIDEITQLVWQRTVDAGMHTWEEAKADCACLGLGGYHDWRLPTRIELVSIVDFTKGDPAIDEAVFPATPSDYFWTSSILAGSDSTAWYVFFLDGNAHSGDEGNAYRVRCVRSMGSSPPSGERYTVSTDGTVLDTRTKLTWERTVDPATYAWNDAKAACSALALSGGGWRLPNMKELQTLVDETTTGPAADSVAFPDTPGEALWTSSPLVGGPPEAWFVDFFSGVSYTSVLDRAYRARCVR